MSADNAIFILDHPRGYAVVEHTFSAMPYDICRLFHEHRCRIFSGEHAHHRARAAAQQLSNELRARQLPLEYGIRDWTNPRREYRADLHQARQPCRNN